MSDTDAGTGKQLLNFSDHSFQCDSPKSSVNASSNGGTRNRSSYGAVDTSRRNIFLQHAVIFQHAARQIDFDIYADNDDVDGDFESGLCSFDAASPCQRDSTKIDILRAPTPLHQDGTPTRRACAILLSLLILLFVHIINFWFQIILKY